MRFLLGPALLVSGCLFVSDEMVAERLDHDNDGHLHVAGGGEDCDDNDPTVHPDAEEVCGNGIDDNCDGVIDDAGQGEVEWFFDRDADGYGASNESVFACEAPEGYVGIDGDCDDGDVGVHPAADEACNDLDDDCDGSADEGLPTAEWWPDADEDGFGALVVPVVDCGVPAGHVAVSGDCDDGADWIHPDAVEVPYDDVDDDCDGGDLVDVDADGFEGSAVGGPDCDDDQPTVFPGAPEAVADGVDQDCDGADHCFEDFDGDGFGSGVVVVGTSLDCGATLGESATSDDCNDDAFAVNPDAAEIPGDAVDQDCDGSEICYEDGDGDGFGTWASPIVGLDLFCSAPGESPVGSDCDDAVPSTYPAAPEAPADGVDQDCDGGDACFEDLDGDDFGSDVLVASTNLVCGDEPLEASVGGDCDDVGAGAEAVFPGAFRDVDGDGYGSDATLVGSSLDCDGTGEAVLTGDCVDIGPMAASIWPGAPEEPGDGIDQDCDDVDHCYDDDDGDDYGDDVVVGTTLDCSGDGESPFGGDCNDAAPSVNPSATDDPGDGYDQDCDGGDACFEDADNDGYGSPELGASGDCDADPYLSSVGTDCDDDNNDRFPGNIEVPGDSVDQNCDFVDDCYRDLDEDGFGQDEVTPGTDPWCGGPGQASVNGDCADLNPDINPDVEEIFLDGIDQDCDGGDWRWGFVAAGVGYSCALDSLGMSACWGLDLDGAASPPPDERFSAIDAGFVATCGLRQSSGDLVCWGYSGLGLTAPPSGGHSAVSVGAGHACAVSVGGVLSCWGDNTLGQADPPSGDRWVQVSAGTAHSCALDEIGRIECWGANAYGVADAPVGLFQQVVAGSIMSCGLEVDGWVDCWGYDIAEAGDPLPPDDGTIISGELATVCGLEEAGLPICWGDSADIKDGADTVSGLEAVAVGATHACGLAFDGALVCWGENFYGEATPPATP